MDFGHAIQKEKSFSRLRHFVIVCLYKHLSEQQDFSQKKWYNLLYLTTYLELYQLVIQNFLVLLLVHKLYQNES